jgi:calcineurin-like phosphoesterase family protein
MRGIREWVIADTHFFHNAVIGFSKRPFKDITEMNESLINNWNKLVNENDRVYVLGDFSFKNSKTAISYLLNRLKGIKILVKGNHDGASSVCYMECGFACVVNRASVEYKKKKILLVHDYNKVSAYDKDVYDYIIHGHAHNKGVIKRDKFFCVSVELTNYKPVYLAALVDTHEYRNNRRNTKESLRKVVEQYNSN